MGYQRLCVAVPPRPLHIILDMVGHIDPLGYQAPKIVLGELSAFSLPLVQTSVQLFRWRRASASVGPRVGSHPERLGLDGFAVADDASFNLEHIRLGNVHAEFWHEVEVDIAGARRKALHLHACGRRCVLPSCELAGAGYWSLHGRAKSAPS